MRVDLFDGYTEHHFSNVEDVGIAFQSGRIWVCINGESTLRAKLMPDGTLAIEYNEPSTVEKRNV